VSLLNTRLLHFRAPHPIDKNEIRADIYGGNETFKQQTISGNSIVTPELEAKAMRAEGSTIEIPVLDNHAPSITNVTQPLVVVDDPVTSQLVAVTFVDYYFGFLVHPAKHFNNEISLQREFNNKLSAGLYAYAAAVEANAIAALEAAKNLVLDDDLGGRYSITTGVVVAPLAEQDAAIGDINMLMMGNKFFGPLDVVANPSLGSHVRNRLAEQGTYNDRNKTYQFSDKDFRFTNQLANGAGHKATAFAIEKGSLGRLERFSADCQMGNITHNHIWSVEQMPIIGERFGTYSYDAAVDYSATDASTARLTATKAEAYGFHKSVAFLTAYNSDTAGTAGPIMKFAIATT
jgi:hypothetical protein